MNLFGWFEKLISEHGSASALRDHLALVKEQKSNFEAENALLKAALNQCKLEKETLETKISELQILLNDATQKINNLEILRVSLKDQALLVQRIKQLEYLNNDLERQLRIKFLGH